MNASHNRGYVLLLVIVFTGIFVLMFSGLVGYATSSAKLERKVIGSVQALALAEAGIDKAIYELNQSGSYTGESGTTLGNGTVSISIATVDSSTKTLTATAYIPNSTSPKSTRIVKANVSIDTSIISFLFGVQVGEGGLTMGNNAVINGNLYSNGPVTGSNGATITGDATVAGGGSATADQQSTTQNNDFNLGDVSADKQYGAQSFQPSASGALTKVSLYIKKVSLPSDITVYITGDDGGHPDPYDVRGSGTIPASAVTGSYNWIDAIISNSPALTGNQTYWIVAYTYGTVKDYYKWGRDSGGGYSNGTGKYSETFCDGSGCSWTNVGGDLDFKTYMSDTTSSLSGVAVQGNAWAYSLSNCSIGGWAKYQSISSCPVGGTSYPGTASPSPGSMPISSAQITDWEETAEAGGITSGSYTLSGTQTFGPRKFDGDLTVNGTLKLSGPVWVKGNVSFSNNSGLTVATSTGNSGAVLIADNPANPSGSGAISLSNNVTVSGNGNSGSYPLLLSTNTSGSAISLNNNVSSAILYASNGTIQVSNNAGANQITAYRLQLNNNATVNYVSGLQSSSFSNGPGGSWAVVPGTYVIVP